MVTKSFEVEVNPKMINWAIETSGWNVKELAGKLKTSEEVIESWLLGSKKPTLRQLEVLAKVVKRPLAAFFLPEPPKEKPLPKDYRMLPGKKGVFHKKTILAIRTARRLQKIAKDLLDNLRITAKPSIEHVTLEDDPGIIASKYRSLFGIKEETYKKWKDAYEMFNFIRKSIEKLNIFIFQISMPIEDARGFSLSDDEPFIIVVNSKEKIEARIFTLLHEFAHLLLKEAAIDMPEASLKLSKEFEENKIEKWCNEFASEFLLPSSLVKKEF